jgi:hypothetical protein
MSTEENKEKPEGIPWDCLDQQVDLINGKFDLGKDVLGLMDTIRKEIETATRNITKALKAADENKGVKADAVFVSHAVLELQRAKDELCCAIILPRHPGYTRQVLKRKEEEPKEEPTGKRSRKSSE